MVKAVQYHPVTDEIIHLDFMRVRRSEKMTISVPLVLVGKPIGVVEGGILSQALNQIEISCFPTNVPDQIEVNVDKMELNSSISVADVSTDDEEVEILSSSEINVATITAPSLKKKKQFLTMILLLMRIKMNHLMIKNLMIVIMKRNQKNRSSFDCIYRFRKCW